ncbi:hypothetical protein QQ045_029543 [Rhodiola kirilowii]
MAQEDDMDLSGEVAAGCLCFRGFGSYQQLGDHDEGWFVRKAKEMRGMLELVAGPKWKNFIRKFLSVQGKNKIKRIEFGYDAESYALNFDDVNIL